MNFCYCYKKINYIKKHFVRTVDTVKSNNASLYKILKFLRM